jgi:hypothetical protein
VRTPPLTSLRSLFARLASLKLDLWHNAFTVDFTVDLSACVNLQSLQCSGSNVASFGLLPSVESLTVAFSRVAKLMPRLAIETPRLRRLRVLAAKDFTNDCMMHVAKLTGLTDLDAPGERITDDGVAHLVGLSLRRLRLASLRGRPLDRVTDLHVREIPTLDTLELGIRLDAERKTALWRALPNLTCLT